MILSKTEKQVLQAIKNWLPPNHARYDFWFTYDDDGGAVSWEGGYELPLDVQFRNEYSLEYGKELAYNKEYEIC